MPEQTAVDEDLETIASTAPVRAHDEARGLVAANPDDEKAALQLRDLIRRFPPPTAPKPDPLAGAAPDVARAAGLMKQGNHEQAEILLRQYLARARNDPQAMRLMALIAAETGHFDNAYKILVRSLEIDRSRADNWCDLGKVIHRIASKNSDLDLLDEAIAALDQAVRLHPDHPDALFYKEAILLQARRLDEARATLEQLLTAHPDASYAWTNYGYLLKTLGAFGEAVAAYRTAVAFDPANSEAWWNLANLKRSRFFEADIRDMEGQLGRINPRQQVGMHYALADAHDRRGDYARAAEEFDRGSRLRFKLQPHDINAVRKQVDAAVSTYTPAYFSARASAGNPSKAPIFIIGMPRSGSTLLEQILASHSQVEGTEELFAIQQIVSEIAQSRDAKDQPVEEFVASKDIPQLNVFGERYLELTRHHRRTDRPHFTDKNPANWHNIGLIHSILPNAKIIDARRNPMDCCFGNYVQHFNYGANYSYSQTEVALVYREYLRLMRHFDLVAPGLVHRVIHDDLVDDFEGEVRRLLDYLDLPFEESCLRYFETERAVHTPSSEQVRQPINRSGFGRWRNYEPWLGELKDALSDALEDWRE
jgi:tetratricopeptide (TPR) repeat protein